MAIKATVAALVAFLSTLLLLPIARRLSLRLGAVDGPGGRKLHDGRVPCLGGVAVLGGLGIAAILTFFWPSAEPAGSALYSANGLALGLLTALLLALGAGDDLGPIPARVKLGLELLLAGGVAFWIFDVRALRVGGLVLGDVFGVVGTAAVAFWIASIVNGYNMVDGQDGLAGGVGALAAAAFTVLGALQGDPVTTLLALALCGSLMAFLTANLPPARVFLGDVGSLPVGFLLAVLAVSTLTGPEGTWHVVPALLVLGFPAADVTIAVLRRFLRSLEMVREDGARERFVLRVHENSGLFTPDRGHIHHRVGEVSPSATTTLFLCLGGCVVFGVLGIASSVLPGAWSLLPAGVAVVASTPVVIRLYPELRVFKKGLLLPVFDTPLVRSRWTHALYDFGLAAAGFLLTGSIMEVAEGGLQISDFASLGGIGLVFVLGMYVGGGYRARVRHMGLWQALRLGVLASLAAGGALLMGWWQMGILGSPAFALLFLYLVLTGVLGARISFRVLDELHRRGSSVGRPTLIYGAGRGGHMLLSGLLSNPSVNLRPVAFLDDDPDLSGREVEGYPVYEPLNGVRLLLCNQDVSDVVVSSEKVSDRRIRELSEVCRRVGSEVQVWRFVWRPSRDGELQRVRAGLGGAEPGVKENWEDASGWSPP